MTYCQMTLGQSTKLTNQVIGHEEVSFVEGHGQRVEPGVVLDRVDVEAESSDHQKDEI